MKRTIIVTTGDIDGIGTEVFCKAILKLKTDESLRIIFYRSKFCPINHLNLLINSSFSCVTVSSLNEALALPFKKNTLIDINSQEPPAQWVVEAAQYCHQNQNTALVTGPLSKLQIQKDGFNYMGHTGILKKISQVDSIFMTFIGRDFNVLLLTGHIPLSEVQNQLTLDHFNKAIKLSFALREKMKRTEQIALLGLNPHSGENGLIGSFEQNILPTWVSQLEKMNQDQITYPLVPDAAFLSQNWPLFFMYICLYHDQGLIPFKMHHQQDYGAQLSLGLPFIRTSVDHGTAHELFNLNKANENSMLEALLLALKLL